VRLSLTLAGRPVAVEVEALGNGRYRVRLPDETVELDVRPVARGAYSVLLDGQAHAVDVTEEGEELLVAVGGETERVRVEAPGRRRQPAGEHGAGRQRVVAPMPGRVVAVLVRVGQTVEPGAPLVVLEAMKMENEFRATARGVVREVRVTPGQAVNGGDLLVEVAPDGDP
jgi:biotin carboxyl carrier protein